MEHNFMSFAGVKLTNKQRNDLEINIRSVLGEDYYILTKNFFESVLNSKAEYIVFLARRCFNLMNIMYRCENAEKVERFERAVLSDSGLLANVPYIGINYVFFGSVPEILIADDILIHGRAINTLIDMFISSLHEFVNKIGPSVQRDDLEYDVLKSITIRTMVQNNKPLLMKSAYYQRLIADGFPQNVWEPVRWHELSSRISRLISESFFSNTSFTLSLYENDNVDIHTPIVEALKKLNFKKSGWNKRFVRDAWVKPIRNYKDDVVALYTFRITQNRINYKYSVVPFVIIADLDQQYSNMFFEKTFGSNVTQSFNNSFVQSKLNAEMLYLVLSYNLLLLIQEECADNNLLNHERLDIDKMYLNFGRDTIYKEAFDKLLAYHKPIFSWEQMSQMLLEATTESTPLISSNGLAIKKIYNSASEALDEVIAEEGEDIERIAFLEYSGQKRVSSTACKQPIQMLFKKIEHDSGIGDDENVAEMAGTFLRHMDTGSVSVGARFFTNGERCDCQCVYRAGEQSQFIHPKKYVDYLPVLIAMERDCNYDCEKIVDRIEKVYQNKSDVKEKLKKYTKMLYNSGQRLKDWDLNWLHWTETDDKTYKIFGESNPEDLLISQMILKSFEEAKAMKEYRDFYPE